MSSTTRARLRDANPGGWSRNPTRRQADDIAEQVEEHLLGLEKAGPLPEGPGARAGYGGTVLSTQAPTGRVISGQDTFVVADLRTFELFRRRLDEDSIGTTVSPGTGTFRWD